MRDLSGANDTGRRAIGDDRTILVTGVTGKQRGAVARYLFAEGWKVRGLTRDVSKPAARELAASGVVRDHES